MIGPDRSVFVGAAVAEEPSVHVGDSTVVVAVVCTPRQVTVSSPLSHTDDMTSQIDADALLRERLTLSVAEFVAVTGLSERTVRALLASGEIPSRKLGGRRLIATADARRLVCAERTAA